MNDEINQDPKPEEFKLPTKPIGRAGAAPMAIVPQSMDDIYRMSKVLLASGMAPYHLKKPEEVTVIIMHGLELGMKPMMAVRRIAVIKGTPTIWGDAVPGLCLATGDLVDWREWADGEGDDKTWHCEVTRKGIKSPKHATFSIAQAKKADLWDERPRITKRGKNGSYETDNDSPWFRHTDRMMTMRARVAFRDIFADVFNGLYIAEELIDRDTQLDESGMRDVTPAREGWKSVDNPMGDDPKAVEIERKNRREAPITQAAAEVVMEAQAVEVVRYWHHPESGSLWESAKDEKLGGDGLVEELDLEQYEKLLAERAEADSAGEGREAALEQAQDAPEEPKEPFKPVQATPEPAKAKNAPAKVQGAPAIGSEGYFYFRDAMATIANAVDGGKLNTWWRGDRQKRLKACTVGELEQLNTLYSNKFIALSKE